MSRLVGPTVCCFGLLRDLDPVPGTVELQKYELPRAEPPTLKSIERNIERRVSFRSEIPCALDSSTDHDFNSVGG